VGEAVLVRELEGVADVHAVAFESLAPGVDGVAADLLQGEEVGGEFAEPGGEGGVEAAAVVGDVERQDPEHGVSLRVIAFTLGQSWTASSRVSPVTDGAHGVRWVFRRFPATDSEVIRPPVPTLGDH